MPHISNLDAAARGEYLIHTSSGDTFAVDLDRRTVRCPAPDDGPVDLIRVHGVAIGRPGLLAIDRHEPGVGFRLLPTGTVTAITPTATAA